VNLAIQAKQRHPDCEVTLLEKEEDCGLHASGRNSGVLHAGFYYTSDSLKARFTREGNQLLTSYCEERDLLINRCGKLVVAKNAGEIETLNELLRRGKANEVELREITEKETKEIEPRAKTFGKALFSPTTASVDPRQVLAALLRDAKRLGVRVLPSTAFVGHSKDHIQTSQGRLSVGYVINAAGLYADKIAQAFGFSQNYQIVPFKGLYLIGDEPKGALRTNIYPVPNLKNPFLGVHFTVTADGKVKIGPTAIPAFWREHYRGLENFSLKELFEVAGRELGLLIRNDFGFRRLALEELAKYFRPRMLKLASELAEPVPHGLYQKWGATGIRAQLFHIKERRLEMDFVYEGDDRSFHVLNAVSPAFTCSMSFTRYLFDEIDALTA
jgi:L-2-hydroxyglutarate oxidase